MPSLPPYSIQVIKDPNELIALTAAQYGAFVNTGNVLHDTLFPPAYPPSQEQIETAAKRHQSTFASNLDHSVFIKAVDTATGDVAGYAVWCFYHEVPDRPKHIEVNWVDDSTPKGRLEKDFAQRTWNEFYQRRVEDMACPHALLDLCFTTPKYERKGVASLLVKYGTEKADKEGWVCYTEASSRGAPVYKRLGFEAKEEVRLRWDDEGEFFKGKGDVVWTFLERPAKKQ